MAVIAVVGISGSGKSYLARRIAAYQSRRKKVIALLTNEEDLRELQSLMPSSAGVIDEKVVMKLNYRKLLQADRNIALILTRLSDEEIAYALDRIADCIYERGNTFLYIDEAHIFFPRYRFSQGIMRLVREGRKLGIDLMFVTQHPVSVNPIVFREAKYLFVFKLLSSLDIERLRPYVTEEDVRSLKRYEFWAVDTVRTLKSRITANEFINYLTS